MSLQHHATQKYWLLMILSKLVPMTANTSLTKNMEENVNCNAFSGHVKSTIWNVKA